MVALTHDNGSRSELHLVEDTFGEFKAWGSTPRWHKGLHITEKINGTHGGISVQEFSFGYHAGTETPDDAKLVFSSEVDDSGDPKREYLVRAQSRKRIITPNNDNFGFAQWVWDNAYGLANMLGFGYHYGEWYGEGIQKNPLGVSGRRFALFNTWHWAGKGNVERLRDSGVPGLTHVPVLHDEQTHGPATWGTIPSILIDLMLNGSKADGAQEGSKPEGIVVWQRETKQRYKILLEEDDKHKWQVAQNALQAA